MDRAAVPDVREVGGGVDVEDAPDVFGLGAEHGDLEGFAGPRVGA